MSSILSSIKQMLGIEEDYEHFDLDIINAINSAFFSLTQLGVGPTEGFSIQDKLIEWDDFIGTRLDLEGIKSFIYLKARLLFDPPSTSFVIDAIERQIKELEWRLNVQAEGGEIPNE